MLPTGYISMLCCEVQQTDAPAGLSKFSLMLPCDAFPEMDLLRSSGEVLKLLLRLLFPTLFLRFSSLAVIKS